jgi:chaperone BCS1
MTKRHIVNISLNPYTTKRQLYNLFYEDRIYIEKPGGMNESFIIPIDKRVYIIEDIDCMSDVVLDRELKEKEQKKKVVETTSTIHNIDDDEYGTLDIPVQVPVKKEKGMSPNDIFGTPSDKNNLSKIDENLDDKLTLSFLLNLLDGVLETPGRVLIMTTNYPEKLDKALIRPGRVDVNICFKKCSHTTIVNMLNYFYDNLDPQLIDSSIQFKDNVFTPAEVYQILFKHIHSPEKAIKELM